MKRETRSEAFAVVVALWFLLGALVVLSLESGCAGAPRVVNDPEPAESALERHLRESSAAIEIRAHCSNGVFTGSGVLIGGDRALTALHVVVPDGCVGAADLRVVGLGWFGTATIEARWDRHDVARLRLSLLRDVRPPRIGLGRVGDALCAATAAPSRAHHCGLVEHGALSVGAGWRQRWGARVELGNSGSGVWDARGRLVGVVTNGRFELGGEPAGVGWYAPVAAEMLR